MLVAAPDTRRHETARRWRDAGRPSRGASCGPVKDQYAGDVNDYVKFSLLRALARVHPGTLQVCWMRTARDGRTDGRRVGYLEDAAGLGALDPAVFTALGGMIQAGRRSVAALQATGVLPGARFYQGMLRDDAAARARYFERVWRELGPEDLVFFDPDNGLQVRSVPHGRRNSCKYLFWHEVERALGERRSVCVYQHFPRVKRAAFVQRCVAEFAERFPAHGAFAVWSPWVAYLVCGAPAAVGGMRVEAEALASRLESGLIVVGPESCGEDAA